MIFAQYSPFVFRIVMFASILQMQLVTTCFIQFERLKGDFQWSLGYLFVFAAPSRNTWSALIVQYNVSVAMIQRDSRRTSSTECQPHC